MVVGPPGFVPVSGPADLQCLVPTLHRLVDGHLTGGNAIDEHLEPRLAHPAEEVEVLQPEEPLRVGEHPGIDNRPRHERRTPARDVHRGESPAGPEGGPR